MALPQSLKLYSMKPVEIASPPSADRNDWILLEEIHREAGADGFEVNVVILGK